MDMRTSAAPATRIVKTWARVPLEPAGTVSYALKPARRVMTALTGTTAMRLELDIDAATMLALAFPIVYRRVIVDFVAVDPIGGFGIVKDGLNALADQPGNRRFVQIRQRGALQT